MSRTINQKGFAALEALLILVIVALVAGTGYYVWHSNQQAKATLDAASRSAQSQVPKINKKSVTNSDSFNGTYHDKVGRFTVTYPPSAKLDFPKDHNKPGSITMVNITFQDGAVLTMTSGPGGRGIPYSCSYDDKTGKTTWSDDSADSAPCPYLVVSAAKELESTATDYDGKTQHVYLVDNNYTYYDKDGTAKTDRASCLTLGLKGEVGKKQYGLAFVDPDLFTYLDRKLNRLIHACTPTDRNGESNYFNTDAIKESKAVLATFKLDN